MDYKYKVVTDFIGEKVLLFKGDTIYGYKKIVSGCSKTYMPIEIIELYSKVTRQYVGEYHYYKEYLTETDKL